MLEFESTITLQAETTRHRSNKVARYKGASWLNPVRKLSLFRVAYPLAEWPVDEMAIIIALLAGIGIVGLVTF